ncbi:MAG TPA: PhzF family phenazine biosynthesis protein [Solirubrobacterales bacterium]|nr:PhzF family phenazine biosynthesis protein [Solirubrobacterales bacterium]
MRHRIAWLDVFAERPLAGNGLAVVDDADEVSEARMLAFAQEMGLSETTFVQSADAEGADYRNRIWTTLEELPFAGHPSLGTAVAVARWRGLEEASFVQQTPAGLQPIDVAPEDDAWRATMLQNPAELGQEVDRGKAMAMAGLGADQADPELPPQLASTGLPQLIAPVASPEAVAATNPDLETLRAQLERLGTDSFYVAWCDPANGRAQARCFVPGIGLGEDPATGSAAGPLGAYLAEHAGCERLVIRQGEEMGRPSVLEVEMVGGRPQVGGRVIPVIDGEVSLS